MFRPFASVRPLVRALTVVACVSATACGSSENGDDAKDLLGQQKDRDGGRRDASSRDGGASDARARTDARTNDKPKPDPVNPDEGTCAAITKEAPVERGQVDIIWVVDNSLSMLTKILQVQANIAKFFETIAGSGADLHVIGVSAGNIAMGSPLEGDADKFLYVFENVNSKLVYFSALGAFPRYKDFLRPDAVTHVVAVTDDQDLMAGADFVRDMEANLGHPFTLHAIVAEPGSNCAAGWGTPYLEAADQTGGQKLSICSQDWTQVFGPLTDAVVEAVPLPCSYDMAEAATSTEKYDPTQVAVTYTPAESEDKQELPKATSSDACGDNQGWYYDNPTAPTKLELCPAACDLVKAGGSMAIAFGCEPTIFL